MTTPYEHLMDDSYDGLLQRALKDGLTWLPWVGKDFRESVHLFIRHTSSYFSWPSWREKLLSLWPDVLTVLPGSPENKQFQKEVDALFAYIQARQS